MKQLQISLATYHYASTEPDSIVDLQVFGHCLDA